MEILQLPGYLYIIIVSSLEKHEYQYPFTIFLALLATILLTPITFLVYFLCYSYKQCVQYILAKLYPDTFIELMEGVDSICCNQRNCIPNVLLLVDAQDELQSLQRKAITMIKSAMHSEHKKLFYSRASCLGYHYYYQNRLAAKDYIKLTTEEYTITSKSELSRAFKAYDIQKMPDNDHALLQIVLFRGYVTRDLALNNYNGGADGHLRLVAFRLHHCLGDGKAIMNLFVSIFGDAEMLLGEGLGAMRERKYSDIPLGKITPQVQRLKEWPSGLRDDNALRGYRLYEDKHIAWFSDNGGDCMRKIRHLRKIVAGVTFLDVVNTCICSSLYDYYEKIGASIPTSVIAGVVLSPAIYSFSYGVGNFTMTNRFSCAAFRMPIGWGDCKIATRLQHIKREYEWVKKCVDVQFNYWTAQNLCETIPAPIVKQLCENVPVTFGVSSLPGCEQFHIFGGARVVDFVFMLPNSPRCGLHFVIYTYAGDFRFALTADKSVIASHEDAQRIVDGVRTYLNEMYALGVAGKLIVCG